MNKKCTHHGVPTVINCCVRCVEQFNKDGEETERRRIRLLKEELAAIEHEQWVSWSKAVSKEVSPERRERWETLWIPYKELSEEMKEHDREWADKVLELIDAREGGGS